MKEEELLKKRLLELAQKSYSQNVYKHTHFLNEYEQSIYQDMKKELDYAHPQLVGGHEHFTRAVVLFGSKELFGYEGEIPLACARISPVFDKFAETLSHRDYLGALMNLGIERYLIGDILVDEKCAYIFCMSHIMDLLKEQLGQVRHTRVGFVASMRLDVLVSQAYGLSRTSSDKLLKAQKVFHNGRLCISSGQKIRQGDIISVRGYGKFLVEDLGKTSKKGRQFLTLAIFQ